MKKTTKKVATKVAKVATPAKECACGCGCKCDVTKKIVLAGTALALVLSVVAIVKRPCPKAIENYINNNPKVIIDSVNKYYQEQEKKNQAAPRAQKEAPAELVAKIVNDKTNYSLGNPKGKFVIIEFFDHQCGWCKKTNAEMYKAIAESKNIRWIPIDTPIFGEASETIARFVLAAGKQGKYAEMHKAVGEAKGRLDEAALIELGKTIGLDGKKLKADADSKAIRGKLEANREYTKALNIGGVPMVIVDGKINPGALIGDKMQEAIAASKK